MTIKIKLSAIIFLMFYSIGLRAYDYSALMADLDRTELEAGRLQEKIDDLEASIRVQTDAVMSLDAELKTRQDFVTYNQKLLRDRLRVLLLFSVPDKLGFIVTDKDFDNVVRGDAILAKMLKQDLKEQDRLSQQVQDVSSVRALVEQEKVKLEENRKLQTSVLDELKKKLVRKKSLLEKAKRTVSSYQAFVTRLEKGSKKIQDIALKGSKNQINVPNYLDIPPVLSSLVPPLRGAIVTGFGKLWDAKIKDWIYNKGVVIDAVYGSKVTAVQDGTVSFAGWIPAYGRVMIIAHNDGLFSVYGHLSKLFFDSGDKVKQGNIIAKTGDSGSIERPSLYFELRNTINNIDPTPLFY